MPATQNSTLAPAKPPNILLIMVDDLGYNDLAINNGNEAIHTPNLDALATEGVRYTRHYANPVCSPARAALLTGQYPERLGYLPNGRGISPETVTLAERLQQAGYTTWHLGKWHIGDLQRTAWPDHQGFDHWLGFLNQWRLAGRHKDGHLTLAKPRYQDPWLQGDTEPGKHFTGHLDDLMTDKAIEMLTDASQQQAPWFLNLWYYAPHAPIQPAADFANLYPATPAGRYRALVNQLDRNIGRVLAHLEQVDATDSTIVIVVSDNGGTNRQINNNAPFAGTKNSVKEGGLRTPLLIRWPDPTMNQQVVDKVVSIQDIYPTLLAALQLDIPTDLDGVSLLPSHDDEEWGDQRDLFWEHAFFRSMLSADGRRRLVVTDTGNGLEPVTEFYDLQADPSGEHPLENPPASIIASMQQQLADWYRDVHLVASTAETRGTRQAALTGKSFQRTPGFGGYTAGIAISHNSTGDLLTQEGVWSIKRSGDHVTVLLGDHELSGPITSGANCHALVISGVFYRHVSSNAGEDRMDINLYIDGARVDELHVAGVLPVPDPSAPTQLGANGSATTNARILNIPLESSPHITPESFSSDLCSPA